MNLSLVFIVQPTQLCEIVVSANILQIIIFVLIWVLLPLTFRLLQYDF
jgi:hypothetical protein